MVGGGHHLDDHDGFWLKPVCKKRLFICCLSALQPVVKKDVHQPDVVCLGTLLANKPFFFTDTQDSVTTLGTQISSSAPQVALRMDGAGSAVTWHTATVIIAEELSTLGCTQI